MAALAVLHPHLLGQAVAGAQLVLVKQGQVALQAAEVLEHLHQSQEVLLHTLVAVAVVVM